MQNPDLLSRGSANVGEISRGSARRSYETPLSLSVRNHIFEQRDENDCLPQIMARPRPHAPLDRICASTCFDSCPLLDGLWRLEALPITHTVFLLGVRAH